MFVKWNPENGEPEQTFNFDSGEVMRKQAARIEKYYDGSFEQWVAGLMIGQIEARAVLLWHMLSQVHDKLRFEDVPDFRVRQLTVEMGVKELQDLLKRVKKMKLPDAQREAFNSQFESDLHDAMTREGYDPDLIENETVKVLEAGELPKPA